MAPAEVVLVGAGDIARCDGQDDEAAAALLDSIPGTVFTLGDNVYGSSTVSPDFNNCYDPSWGRHKARTRPAAGHMEYWSPGAATYWQYFGAAAGDSGKGYYCYDLGGKLLWNTQVYRGGFLPIHRQLRETVGASLAATRPAPGTRTSVSIGLLFLGHNF